MAIRAGPALRALLDLVWPPRCVTCGHPAWDDEVLCALCAARVPAPCWRCPRCGRRSGPWAEVDPCALCRNETLGLDGVVAAWSYLGIPRELVLALKYHGLPEAAAPLARGLADALRAAGVPGDLLVPVPLSRRRRQRRGYDQARVLAQAAAPRLGLRIDARALRRRRDTPPQVGLPRGRRRRGPRGAFTARPARVRDRAVLLVDDVLTTGATARACAVALRRAGAVSVVAAVACRTQRP